MTTLFILILFNNEKIIFSSDYNASCNGMRPFRQQRD